MYCNLLFSPLQGLFLLHWFADKHWELLNLRRSRRSLSKRKKSDSLVSQTFCPKDKKVRWTTVETSEADSLRKSKSVYLKLRNAHHVSHHFSHHAKHIHEPSTLQKNKGKLWNSSKATSSGNSVVHVWSTSDHYHCRHFQFDSLLSKEKV